jgi:serine/threonine protein kinase
VPYTFKHGDRPIEGYTVQRAVGRGGFGEVYYALADSGKQVALKYLRENPEVELRGIAQVMNLKSPHLITIYDVRKGDAGEPFVVMEYVSGPSLQELLVAEPAGLGPAKAAFFLSGIAKGLTYLHERGIVHRDLKPGNIFYDDGYVKIGDYGLSKHISMTRHSGQTVSVGTVHYMAPEIGSGSYTRAIDIYALGVVLFEMLTGKLPFTGSSMGEILMRHLSERPDTSGLPEPFASVIAKALAKDPKDRFQDVNEMVDAITSSTDIRAGMAAFDPGSLTRGPRLSPEHLDRTMTSPPPIPYAQQRVPPAPPLDARAAAWPGMGKVHKLQEKADKLARKIEQKAAKLEDKLNRKLGLVNQRLGAGGAAPRTPQPIPVAQIAPGGAVAAPERRSRWAQLFIVPLVISGVSIALATLHRGQNLEEVTGALWLYLAGGVIGALLGYKMLRRTLSSSPVIERCVYAAMVAFCLLPGLMAASEVGVGADVTEERADTTATLDESAPPAAPQPPAPGASVRVSVDGDEVTAQTPSAQVKIDRKLNDKLARKLDVHSRSARKTALEVSGASDESLKRLMIPLVALFVLFNWTRRIDAGRRGNITVGDAIWAGILGLIVGNWEAAALCATLSVMIPSMAGLWPLPGGAAALKGRRPLPAGAGIAGGFPAYRPGAPAPAPAGAAGISPTVPAAQDQPFPDGFAARPSFIGRTTNAGLSFAGKMLLLAGLLAAALFNSVPRLTLGSVESPVTIDHGFITETIRTPSGAVVDRPIGQIRQIAVLVPLILGTLVLVIARRNDVGRHFVKGFFGAVLALIAALLALGPAATGLNTVFTKNDWQDLRDPAQGAPLLGFAFVLALALLLLFWPKPRGDRPIVI